MDIICRPGTKEDMPRLLEIEKHATPKLLYLEDAKEQLFDPDCGELIVAETDGLPIGFGRFTLEYDGAGWLEILRVHEDWQRKGCGRTIWKRYMELAALHHVPAMRMYTGEKNVASRSLAEQNGLHVAWHTLEGVLTRDRLPGMRGTLPLGILQAAVGFERVTDAEKAAVLMEPYAQDYHGYLCTNRTYFALGEPLYKGLVADYEVWEKDGSVLVTGARFLPERGINICYMGGDLPACAAKALTLLAASDRPRLVAMISAEDEARREALESVGFVFTVPGIIMLERVF